MADDKAMFDRYFDEIKDIWEKLGSKGRIIPFCTPLKIHPRFLIIGTNHSDKFDPVFAGQNKRIADSFAQGVPDEMHSLIEHNHEYAKGLRKIIGQLQSTYPNMAIDREWIATNRCAVQTPTGGIDALMKFKQFAQCEAEMDRLIKRFIAFSRPKNVLLTGGYACALYYDEASIQQMACRQEAYEEGGAAHFNLIPLWHLSAKVGAESSRQKSYRRLRRAIQDGLCEI